MSVVSIWLMILSLWVLPPTFPYRIPWPSAVFLDPACSLLLQVAHIYLQPRIWKRLRDQNCDTYRWQAHHPVFQGRNHHHESEMKGKTCSLQTAQNRVDSQWTWIDSPVRLVPLKDHGSKDVLDCTRRITRLHKTNVFNTLCGLIFGASYIFVLKLLRFPLVFFVLL